MAWAWVSGKVHTEHRVRSRQPAFNVSRMLICPEALCFSRAAGAHGMPRMKGPGSDCRTEGSDWAGSLYDPATIGLNSWDGTDVWNDHIVQRQ